MYVATSRIWSTRARVLAAFLMLVAPAGLYYSRVAPRSVLPVSFILAWLWCMAAAEFRGRHRALVLGALVLGIGCYSHTTAIVLMPVYLVITLGLSFYRRRTRWLPAAIVAAFLLPASFGMWWVATHRSVYVERIDRYRIYDASRLNPLQGMKDFANYNNIQERVSLYWDFFDPQFLFFRGGAETAAGYSTGMLPAACALWMPFGLYVMLKRRTAFDVVLLAGLLAAPLPAILVDEPHIARRDLAVIPFAILAAVIGADTLLASGSRFWRVVTIGLLATAAAQGIAGALQL
jgi:hypothetical protein